MKKERIIALALVLVIGYFIFASNSSKPKPQLQTSLNDKFKSDFGELISPKWDELQKIVGRGGDNSKWQIIETTKEMDAQGFCFAIAEIWGTAKDPIGIELPRIVHLTFVRVKSTWNLILYDGYLATLDAEETKSNRSLPPEVHTAIKELFPQQIEMATIGLSPQKQ